MVTGSRVQAVECKKESVREVVVHRAQENVPGIEDLRQLHFV